MKQKDVSIISGRDWFLILFLGLSGQIAWNINNVWFNTYMYDWITPNPSAIAWLVGVSAVVATLTTLTMGTLSDRVGKRRPFIGFGYMIWGFTIIAYPLTALIPETIFAIAAAVVAAAVMTFFGSTANDAAFNAWTTDISDETNRGLVSSVISILPLLALIIGFGLSGALIDQVGYHAFFYGAGILITVTGVVGYFLLRDSTELHQKSREETGSYLQQLLNVVRLKTIQDNRELFLVFISIGIFSVSAQIFMPYIMIYMNNYLEFTFTTAGIAIAVPIFIAMVLAIPAGKITDRGYGPVLTFVAPVMTSAGLWFLSFIQNLYLVIIAVTLGMAGFIIMNLVLIAWIKNLMPLASRGQFEGIRMIFMVGIPMIIGPVIGSVLINNLGIPTILNGEPGHIPTPIIFQVAGVGMLFALLPLNIIRRGKKAAAQFKGLP